MNPAKILKGHGRQNITVSHLSIGMLLRVDAELHKPDIHRRLNCPHESIVFASLIIFAQIVPIAIQ